MSRFPVALEEGTDGVIVHGLGVPGSITVGATVDDALEHYPAELSAWLNHLGSTGEPVPPPEAELEIRVEEWVSTRAAVLKGESVAWFDWDLEPLPDAEMARGLQRLGSLRGRLLNAAREAGRQAFDAAGPAGTVIDELARAQWLALRGLGSSPLGEVPDRPLGRLDTAMALVVSRFTGLPRDRRGMQVNLDGEIWTPRKVLRTLLRLEWELGRTAIRLLKAGASAA